MVYDPIRDIEVPSPAASTHPSESWKNSLTPGSGYFDPARHSNGSSPTGYGIPGGSGGGGGGSGGYDARPPAFHSTPQHGPALSPSAGMGSMRRSVSGGLRGLLNDADEDTSRRSSGHTVSSFADGDEDGGIHAASVSASQHRPSILRMLNEASGSGDGRGSRNGSSSGPGAAGMTKSTSISSLVSSSPANNSPRMTGQGQLDPSGFLTPATTSRRDSRSPHPYPINTSVSPGQYHSALPAHDTPIHGYDQHQHQLHHTPSHLQTYPSSEAGPSRRRTSHTPGTVSRPMLPPDTIPRQEYYDPSRNTPGAQILSLPTRSPSQSVSPRSHHQALPYPSSRPGSATSSGQPFSFQPPQPPHHQPSESPSTSYRRLSDDPSRPPSSLSRSRPTSAAAAAAAAVASRRSSNHRSVPPRAPYQPNRISQPHSVLVPIYADEIARLRSAAMTNNPLRRKARKPAPSWSGPSPGGAASRDTPLESSTSYFPDSHQTPEPTKAARRRESVSSGRPSMTPGSAMTPVPEESAGTGKKGVAKRKKSGYEGDQGGEVNNHQQQNGHDGQRRKGNDGHYVGNSAVASHYNARPEVGVQSREFSPIIGLKKFNNWIKSVLIGKFTWRGPRGEGAHVLDIGCGKGGDLNKWKQAKIQLYVALDVPVDHADIADMSVEQARERYMGMRPRAFDAFFFAHDCFAQGLSSILPDHLQTRDLYDNVTMQFCMHYAFESPSKARMMLENVSRYMRPGGVFIGTIPNADILLAKLDNVPEDATELRFGNSCYFIEFTERQHKGMYGHAYRFYLQDAVDDVPEYIVHWDNFVDLALEHRLRVVYKRAFNEVLAEEQNSRDFGGLLRKMGVVNDAGESAMDADQWEAASESISSYRSF